MLTMNACGLFYRISLVSARQHQRQGISVHVEGALQHDDCTTGIVVKAQPILSKLLGRA